MKYKGEITRNDTTEMNLKLKQPIAPNNNLVRKSRSNNSDLKSFQGNCKNVWSTFYSKTFPCLDIVLAPVKQQKNMFKKMNMPDNKIPNQKEVFEFYFL